MRNLGLLAAVGLMGAGLPVAAPRARAPGPTLDPLPEPGGAELYRWDDVPAHNLVAEVQRARARGDRQRRQGRKPWKGRP